LQQTIDSGVPHVSVYMLEIDQDSRLGRELIAGGTRYHAHFVPDEDLTADLYGIACDALHGASIQQYEISNFAQEGRQSRHNLKYWTRQPYFGFGVDAHSMLLADEGAVRFSTPDSLEDYVAGKALQKTVVDQASALEEGFFLGLRLSRGVDLNQLIAEFGGDAVADRSSVLSELCDLELIERDGNIVRLTPRGRLLSNEVFERFLARVA